jgi:DNA-binding FadR family transcriptional regulator
VVIDFEGVDAAQIWDAREIVEDLCARLATERLDDEMAELIETALADETEAERWGVSEHVVHHAIACATRNRPLVLFVDALAELSTARVRGALSKRASKTLPPTSDAHRAHQLIVAAILDGEPDTAAGRMRRHVRAAGKSY